jgi:hypothetical protein
MTPESLSIGMTTICIPLSNVFVKCCGNELAIDTPGITNHEASRIKNLKLEIKILLNIISLS